MLIVGISYHTLGSLHSIVTRRQNRRGQRTRIALRLLQLVLTKLYMEIVLVIEDSLLILVDFVDMYIWILFIGFIHIDFLCC